MKGDFREGIEFGFMMLSFALGAALPLAVLWGLVYLAIELVKKLI